VTFVWIDHDVCHAGFADAIQQVGWLAQAPTGISLPHFNRHNGPAQKKTPRRQNASATGARWPLSLPP
jgi:hypothetical protein